MEIDIEVLKQAHRYMWGEAGDYAAVGSLIELASTELLTQLPVEGGPSFLDVGAGTGNLSIPAARAGAQVVGVDLAPQLLDKARDRATAAGVEVEWVEGDTEDLPFEDGRFDIVASVFGVMFAPRHEVSAAELARVCRQGGTIANCAWTPDGYVGRSMDAMSRYLPEPPSYASPPPLWGSEDYVRELLARTGVELTFDRRMLPYRFPSVEAYLDFMEENAGPFVVGTEFVKSQGKYDEARAELAELTEEFNRADDGTCDIGAEYLVAIGRSAGGR